VVSNKSFQLCVWESNAIGCLAFQMTWNPIVCFSLQMKSNPIWGVLHFKWCKIQLGVSHFKWCKTQLEVSHFKWSQIQFRVSHFKWHKIQFGVLCMCATCCWHSLVQGVRLLNPQRFITTWVLFLQSNYQRNDHQNPQLPCALTHSLSLHVCMSNF